MPRRGVARCPIMRERLAVTAVVPPGPFYISSLCVMCEIQARDKTSSLEHTELRKQRHAISFSSHMYQGLKETPVHWSRQAWCIILQLFDALNAFYVAAARPLLLLAACSIFQRLQRREASARLVVCSLSKGVFVGLCFPFTSFDFSLSGVVIATDYSKCHEAFGGALRRGVTIAMRFIDHSTTDFEKI